MRGPESSFGGGRKSERAVGEVWVDDKRREGVHCRNGRAACVAVRCWCRDALSALRRSGWSIITTVLGEARARTHDRRKGGGIKAIRDLGQ